MADFPGVDLSVCLVSWNVWEDLRRCLDSLLRSCGLAFRDGGRAVSGAAVAEAASPSEPGLTAEIIVG